MKILLVEDSDPIRERLKALIGEIGVEAVVSEATGEDEAIQDVHRGAPDLVVLDLSLAQGSGIGVLRFLQNRTPRIPVAVLTSHADGPYRKKCLQIGAQWFFDKARGFEEVRHVLEGFSRAGGRQITTETTGACNAGK